MDKFSDFFKSIRERLSSPLISSFIIAWLIANWKIPIGLFFYKFLELKTDGYNSYFDLVTKNTNAWLNLYLPLIIAGCYTFLFPFLRNLILIFNEWIETWGNNQRLKISKERFVSISYLMDQKLEYDKSAKKLLETIQSINQTEGENTRLNGENLDFKQRNRLLEAEINSYKSRASIKTFTGDWKCALFDQNSNTQNHSYKLGDKLRVLENTIIIYNNNKQVKAYNDIYSISNDSLWVLFMTDSSDNEISTWLFRLNNNLDMLEGKDNNGRIINLERIRN